MNDRIKANYEKDLKQKARDMEEMEKKLAQEQAALEEAEEKRRREAAAKAEAARKEREAEAAKVAREREEKRRREAEAAKVLSPAQIKELSKQLSDAANDGDTAKVLKLIEDGGDIEWQNPDDVSE